MMACAGTRHKSTWNVCNALLLLLGGSCAGAAPPILFSQPAYQSAVRGDPGDLLILAGDGFASTNTVVYQALANTTQPPAPPTSIPTTFNATAGVAPVVSTLNVPHSLTIALPAVMQTDQAYILWVQDASGAWSNGIEINDARPLWITPDSSYVSAPKANLPRYLKVVGRNLQPAPGATTQVQLTGPTGYVLTATNHGYPGNALDRYVAQVTLPTNMAPGTYTVQVSRDGVSWLGVASGQTLVIAPDPVAPPTFSISDAAYGGCAPNDGVDDTPCIVKAITAARAAGGGSVVFGPGLWDMSNDSQSGVVPFGVLVPVGVNLTGADASSTTIQWTGSTDNIGVTGYLLERCAGAGCANFTQVANVTGGVTTYSDVGLASATTYTYRVRATDVAMLTSSYSTVASATTAAAVDN